MILYLDTSALVKRYVEEEGTELVDKLWESAEAVTTSVVAFAEALAAFTIFHSVSTGGRDKRLLHLASPP